MLVRKEGGGLETWKSKRCPLEETSVSTVKKKEKGAHLRSCGERLNSTQPVLILKKNIVLHKSRASAISTKEHTKEKK